ncbi:MAG: hypothetical protein ACLGI6_19265 [Gammaproteobacteria bacterium]
MSILFDKTDKGREEIATRKYRVSPRLRSLLVMIDGQRPLEDLLANLGAIGVTEESIDELLRDEFIIVVSKPDVAPPAPAHPRPVRPGMRRPGVPGAAGPATVPMDVATMEAPAAPAPAPASAPAPAVPSAPSARPTAEDAFTPERFTALYEFYNQTIKSTMGFRGVMLQLKMEKCTTLDDFKELRLTYLEAVQKAKGREMALSLRDRLDQLLGGRPSPDPFTPD